MLSLIASVPVFCAVVCVDNHILFRYIKGDLRPKGLGKSDWYSQVNEEGREIRNRYTMNIVLSRCTNNIHK